MLLLASLAHAACPGMLDRTALDLSGTLRRAETAYGDADVEGFQAAAAELDALLPCLEEQVPRSMVARLHRTYGILSFAGRDSARAEAAFRGARSLEADYHFPSELVPAQHPMAKLYETSSEPGPSEAVPMPAQGALVFDGRRRAERPQERLTLFQRVDADENVRETVLLWPGDPLPAYETAAVAEAEAEALELRAKKTRDGSKKGRLTVPLLLTAAGTAVLAGGVYAAAGVSRGAYERAPLADRDAAKGRTNALVFTSAGLGAAAVGVGVTAVATGKW